MRGIFLLPFLFLAGCASHSTQTARSLSGEDNPEYRTLKCQIPVKEAEKNDEIKTLRMIGSPLAVIASGGTLLIPVLLGNAGLETADHLDARKIAQNCGGQPKSDERIAAEVAGSAAISVVAQGTQIGPLADTAQKTQH